MIQNAKLWLLNISVQENKFAGLPKPVGGSKVESAFRGQSNEYNFCGLSGEK